MLLKIKIFNFSKYIFLTFILVFLYLPTNADILQNLLDEYRKGLQSTQPNRGGNYYNDDDDSYYPLPTLGGKILKTLKFGPQDPTIETRKVDGMEIYKGTTCKSTKEINIAAAEMIKSKPPNDNEFVEHNNSLYPNFANFNKNGYSNQYYLTIGVKRDGDTELVRKISETIPPSILVHIYQFQIYSDQSGKIIAYIAFNKKNLKNIFGVNLFQFSNLKNTEKIHTLLHEIGHIVSKNVKNYQPYKINCSGYSDKKGNFCSPAGQPLGDFYNTFWKGKTLDDDSRCMSIYGCRKGAFEDFADTFSMYVMSDFLPELKYADKTVQNKVHFMNLYPELRKYKKEILEKLLNSRLFCEE